MEEKKPKLPETEESKSKKETITVFVSDEIMPIEMRGNERPKKTKKIKEKEKQSYREEKYEKYEKQKPFGYDQMFEMMRNEYMYDDGQCNYQYQNQMIQPNGNDYYQYENNQNNTINTVNYSSYTNEYIQYNENYNQVNQMNQFVDYNGNNINNNINNNYQQFQPQINHQIEYQMNQQNEMKQILDKETFGHNYYTSFYRNAFSSFK